MSKLYNVIVVGGGHAGVEAAYAAAKLKGKVLLITINIDTIGKLSCNPAIGGIGKSQLVKEIDALGGLMGAAANFAGIHYKILNRSKGNAVQSTRIQVDRTKYQQYILNKLIEKKNIDIIQQEVTNILINNNKIIGIETKLGMRFFTSKIILTMGTFLNGLIHIGNYSEKSGRSGEIASIKMSDFFLNNHIKVKRFKTGTPPRLDKRTINFSNLEIEKSENINSGLSFYENINIKEIINCYITHTNDRTHQIIKKNIKNSFMYSDRKCCSKGPRYCPSIEDKVMKFDTQNKHQIFLEPEGKFGLEVYLNGVSTSLPYLIQEEFIKTIPGLENSLIIKPGYAIEYDFFDSRKLLHTLNHKFFKNLYFAGQINGTTGYEEAAAQGIIAGINSILSLKNELWYPNRNEAYIGVLLDDLVSIPIYEPYRMFTSRAEYRLSLREDNADFRLSETAYLLGLLENKNFFCFLLRKNRIKNAFLKLKKIICHQQIHTNTLYQKYKNNFLNLREIDFLYIESEIKYAGYIKRYKNNTNILSLNLELITNYNEIDSLSNELKENLNKIHPINIKQLIKIPGITPSGINAIRIFLDKRRNAHN